MSRIVCPLTISTLLFASACSTESSPSANGEPGKAAPAAAAPAAAAPALSTDAPLAAIQQCAREVRKAPSGWRTMLPAPPQQKFTPSKNYFWELTTNEGPIKIRLMPQVAPMHVTSTIYLTELGFYDGLTFHRVIPGFMAQGGCPLGTGTGSPGYKYQGEFDDAVVHDRPGLLSMANAGPGTDGSQFFITFTETRGLDGKHTIFGEVVAGMDTVKKLEQSGSRGGKTSKPLTIDKAAISLGDR